jgi:hypothetical protein
MLLTTTVNRLLQLIVRVTHCDSGSCTRTCEFYIIFFFGRKSVRVVNVLSFNPSGRPHCHGRDTGTGEIIRQIFKDVSSRDVMPILYLSYHIGALSFMKVRISPEILIPHQCKLHDESTRQLNDGDQSKLDCTPHFDSGKTVDTSMGSLASNRQTSANRLILSCELGFRNTTHRLTFLTVLRISRRFVHKSTYQQLDIY